MKPEIHVQKAEALLDASVNGHEQERTALALQSIAHVLLALAKKKGAETYRPYGT